MLSRFAPSGSFSGSDMLVTIVFPGTIPLAFGEASTVTYSSMRIVNPVATLGRISVKGFTKGSRMVAGQIIFTVFKKHIVSLIRDRVPYLRNYDKIMIDELPPFDIIINMGNEYGERGRLAIYGVTIYHDGQVMSIEDMMTEANMGYVARSIRPLDEHFNYSELNYSEIIEVLPRFEITL